jgi:hypothetical protein
MREIVTYGDHVVAVMRRADEEVKPIVVVMPDPGFHPTHKKGPTTPRTERVPIKN